MAIRTILVPVDFELNSSIAVDYAYELAEELGAKVHLLHAYPPVVVPDGYGAGSIPYSALHTRAREQLQEIADKHGGSPATGECVAKLGDPLSVILEQASALDVDLVVLGTHARSGFKRLMMGSVAEGVMRALPIPVLIAKGARAAAAAHEGQPQGAWSHTVSIVPGPAP